MSDRHPALDALREAEPPVGAEARMQAGAWARIDASPRSAARWWLAGGLAAAAAGLALWLGAASPAPAPAEAPAGPFAALAPHQITPAEGASLTVVEQIGAGARLRLTAGEASFNVAPLLPNERFLVETPRADVAVLGTQFSVRVDGAGCTHVQVREGRVSVTPTDAQAPSVLTAGQSRAVCAVVAPPVAPVTAAPVLPPPPPSDDAALQAMDRYYRGEGLAQVVETLAAYVEGRPKGTSRESALLVWSKALADLGRTAEARVVAGRYLAEFPQGMGAAMLRRQHGL